MKPRRAYRGNSDRAESMKSSAENSTRAQITSKCSGGCSMGPASRSPRTSTATAPALTRKMNSDPPTTTTASEARKAVSTTGCESSDVMMVAAISRHSRSRRSSGAVPITSPTRNSPPITGVAISSLNSESAVAWISVTCQFAAATSAPRLRTGLRNGSVCTRDFMLNHQCGFSAPPRLTDRVDRRGLRAGGDRRRPHRRTRGARRRRCGGAGAGGT